MKEKRFYLLPALVCSLVFLCTGQLAASKTVEVAPGKAAMAVDIAKALFFSEFSDASISIPNFKYPINQINGKFKLEDGFTQFEAVTFKILGSELKGYGRVAKGSGSHDFHVSSDAVSYADIKKLIPALAAFDIKGVFKFDCAVSGTTDAPVVDAKFDLSGAGFDFSSLRSELKDIDISAVKLRVVFSGGRYDIKKMSFNFLDGTVELAGLFDPDKTSETVLDLKGAKIDAEKLFSRFQRQAGKITGLLETDLKIKNPETAAGMVVEGSLSMQNGVLKDFDFLKKLGDKLRMPIEKLKYEHISGDFSVSANGRRISFKDLVVTSNFIKLKSTGVIDENKAVKAKLFAEAAGGSIGGIKNQKLAAIFKKVISRVKLNFKVSGTTDNPKLELDLGQ